MEEKSMIERIFETPEEEIDEFITSQIKELDEKSTKVEQLGFIGLGKSLNIHHGFIPLNTRIKYENLAMETYGMETTDFYYEYARFIKKNNIKTKTAAIYSLEYFINSYFGLADGEKARWAVLNEKAMQTETDDEYFEALDNCKIGDMKGRNCALCTERGALAQQILSLLRFESFYCIGCLARGDIQEAHCFNIVKRKNDYAILDYSMPVGKYNEKDEFLQYYPFIGILSNEEFEEFITNGVLKSFDEYKMIGKECIPIDGERTYVVGEFSIDLEEPIKK